MRLRGIDFTIRDTATTIVAELGDLRRFPHPRGLMGYLGLVPSEHLYQKVSRAFDWRFRSGKHNVKRPRMDPPKMVRRTVRKKLR